MQSPLTGINPLTEQTSIEKTFPELLATALLGGGVATGLGVGAGVTMAGLAAGVGFGFAAGGALAALANCC